MIAAQPTLSRSEWQAVSIAFNDAARCGCVATREPGALRKIYARLTGHHGPRPLANERLEAIRSFVCSTRRSRKPAEALVPVLHDQGFSPAQVDALALLSL
ncbi:hypothetical protein HL653_19475 [Sphingomonas sp. AP4-R1]|uniref:hypothetical protein n=1 Tax=Sphingomonas sp. AP4-R1 TaxID=2735134 RepID=UPI0014933186|nr:hypothetical protein [Sphingomonas sp. AP4-R1]QJU59642.1 hypothetical protein HL653_19475 [Sphingomonas sp. AP4-R1]